MAGTQQDVAQKFRVRVIGGPAAGQDFDLPEEGVVIGRAPDSGIALADTMLSRRHLRIFPAQGQWKVEDLKSTNGTWVHGQRINSEIFLPCDTSIRIGRTLLEIVDLEHEAQRKEFDESRISFRMQPLSAESLESPEPVEARFRREQAKLTSIYKVQGLLANQTDQTQLYQEILEVIAETIPTENASLLLYDEVNDIFTLKAQRTAAKRKRPRMDEKLVSRSVIKYVKENSLGIVSMDAPHDDRFQGESLADVQIHSVMCVPMLAARRIIGVIYLTSATRHHAYSEDDLKLLTAIAHSAGLAIANKNLMDENIRSERMAAIGMTAASLSHHVKNILTGLEGSVSLLRMGIDSKDTETMDEAWEILSKNQRRLSALMLDLLNLAKDESISFGIYNLTEIMNETIELVRAQMQVENITLDFDNRVNDAIFAELDSRAVHRAILNLLNNAADAVTERHGTSGKGRVEVVLEMPDEQEVAIIQVRDNGTGISEEQQNTIFELFHTSKGTWGTGLGLAVTKRIIDCHQGKIAIDSRINDGATFTVRLPLRQTENSTDFFTQALKRRV